MEYDAILTDWYSVRHAGLELIYGTIKDDTKGRFSDGTKVRTSLVQTFHDLGDKGLYARTMNTIYKLENPHKG